MIARREILLSIYGAWRLFLRDPRGLEWLDTSLEGYWKSFFCAVIVLPGYAMWIGFVSIGADYSAGTFRIITVEGITYVISWVSWPLLMAYLAPLIDRDSNYIRYIVAYNWAAALQIAVYLIILGVQLIGAMPVGFLAVLSFGAVVIILSYQWYLLRIALEVSSIAAVGLVASEFILGQVIRGVGHNILR